MHSNTMTRRFVCVVLCCLPLLMSIVSAQQSPALPGTSFGTSAPTVTNQQQLPLPAVKTLTNGVTVLILPTVEEVDHIAKACHEYLAKPMVFLDADLLTEFTGALGGMSISDDTELWVGVSGFTPSVAATKCLPVHQFPENAVCFKTAASIIQEYSKCGSVHVSSDINSLDASVKNCHGNTFTPVCQNGLTCSENSLGLCGVWLIGCPFHGQCVDNEDVDGDAAVKVCRFAPPRVRMTQIKDQKFEVECEVHDDCFQTSYGAIGWNDRRENVYMKYFQNDKFLATQPNTDPLDVLAAEWNLDSEFQCKYTFTGISSKQSRGVQRPVVETYSTAVALGSRVELSCLDSGTEHRLDETVSFEWATPSNPNLPKQDEHLVIESVSPNDAGNYRCRSNLGGLRSVWSSSVELNIVYKDPTLTFSELEIFYGSAVTLTCLAQHLPQGFKYSFYKDGALVQKGDDLSEYSIVDVSFRDEGEYDCVIESSTTVVGPSGTVQLVLEKINPPLLISDKEGTVRQGERVTLNCENDMSYEEIVEYSFTFQNFSDDTAVEVAVGPSPAFEIASVTAQEEGTYKCFVTLLDGSAEPHTAFQTSNDSNPVEVRMVIAVLRSSATTVPEGTDLKLTCHITNYRGHVEQYSWLKAQDKGFKVLTTSLKNTTIIRNFQAGNEGVYTCRAVLADPSLRDPPLTSAPVELISAPRYQKCPCVCSPQTLSLPPATPVVIEESKQALQKNLSMKKSLLSSNVRRVSSAPDDRPTSVSAGYVAVALLSLVAFLVLIPDALSAALFLSQLCQGHCQDGTASALKEPADSCVTTQANTMQNSE